MSHNGSIAIIAAEQYLVLKESIPNIHIYNNNMEIYESDVLLIISCLTMVQDTVLCKFKHIAYFFDDVTMHKLKNSTEYREKIRRINVIFHPVKESSIALLSISNSVFYVPWTLSRLQSLSEKPVRPSIFVDMDGRKENTYSIADGVAFIKAISSLDVTIFAPSATQRSEIVLPDEILGRVQTVPFCPHDEYMSFLSKLWFYASGIRGSYEFQVLETAFLGCGLISIRSAVRNEHRNRRVLIDFNGQDGIVGQLKDAINQYDPYAIAADAVKLYPRTSGIIIKEIIDRFNHEGWPEPIGIERLA